jgi:hypothetical protein
MEIQTLEKVVDEAGSPTVTINAVKDITCCLHRQCGDLRTLAAWGDHCDTGCDTEAYRFELAQFIHQGIDLRCTCFFGVENGLGVVEDYEHVLGGKQGSEGCEILGIFNPRTEDPGESGKEIGARSRKLITAHESTVFTKSYFNPIVVEDGEGNGCFSNPPCTDESDGLEVIGKPNDLLNQVIASETVPRRRGR